MEGLSIIIPVYNKVEITEKCISSIFELNKDCIFEVIIVDNGSTDDTEKRMKANDRITYLRNKENLGVAKALNKGAAAASYEILCFMHNDVHVFEKNWAEKILDFILQTPDAGVIGLYGARRIRSDASFMGRSIVHAKLKEGNMGKVHVEVAVVDGLLMAMQKSVYKKAGGFDDRYIMHFYDKYMSLKAHTSGYKNYVINIPFTHEGAGTRSAAVIEEDIKLRRRMKEVFLTDWRRYLPLDVRPKGERLKDWIMKYV